MLFPAGSFDRVWVGNFLIHSQIFLDRPSTKSQFTSYTPNCQPSSTSSVADSRHLPLSYCIIYHHHAAALHHGYWLSIVLVLNPIALRYSDTGISQCLSEDMCLLPSFYIMTYAMIWMVGPAVAILCMELVSLFNCRQISDISGCCSVWLNFFVIWGSVRLNLWVYLCLKACTVPDQQLYRTDDGFEIGSFHIVWPEFC